MNREERQDLYQRAIATWGADDELAMLYEEIGELLVALGHLRRKRATVQDVLGEVADVRVMLEQVEVVLGMPVGAADSIMAFKVQRLAGRLDKAAA